MNESGRTVLNILFLTQILPYPPDAGPRVKTWHVLRHLAERGHRIRLVSYVRPEERPYMPEVAKICEQLVPVPIRRSRWSDLLFLARCVLTGRPFLIERDDLRSMRRAVRRVLEPGDTDVIHADQLGMAQFALRGKAERRGRGRSPAILFDSHNAVWMIVDRMADTALFAARPLLRAEARRLRRYEAHLVEAFDHSMAVTDIDRRALAARGGSLDRITTIPIAVDTTALQPTARLAGSKEILTLGTLHYPPNADGIRWFMQEVYPGLHARDAEIRLTVAGRNPPQDFRDAADRDPSIEVTGYVPELEPYMQRAAALVVPVRAGGGMRVRILEAFARAMPVVTTTTGLEGIDAVPGRDVLVADEPADFAAAVVRILESPELAARLAANGRRLAEEKYDWKRVLEKMDEVYAVLTENDSLGTQW